MAYRFDFEPTFRILRGCFEGDVDEAQLAAFCLDAGARIEATNPLRELTDFSDVTSFTASPAAIRRLARNSHSLPDPSSPRVIIAPNDLIFGTARMYEIEGEALRPHIYVVRTLEEALAIFGITGDLRYQSIESLPRQSSRPEVTNSGK